MESFGTVGKVGTLSISVKLDFENYYLFVLQVHFE